MPALAACLLLVVTAQIQSAAPGTTSDGPLTPEAYAAHLDSLASRLAVLGPAEAQRLSSALAPRWIVASGTERVAVDMRWLVAALREARAAKDWPAIRERLRRRLDLLRTHAADAMAAEPAHGDMRASVTAVLARPEFTRQDGSSWREIVQRRIVEWIESLLRGLGMANVDGRRVAVGLAWLAGLAALAGLGLWIARILTSGPAAARYRLAPDAHRTLSSRDWARRAMAALRQGDPREAVRCAYNGALRRLEEEGAWRVDGARTPREYLRMLRPGDDRHEPVRYLTVLFERVWYGHHDVNAGEQARVSASLERLGCLHAGDRAT